MHRALFVASVLIASATNALCEERIVSLERRSFDYGQGVIGVIGDGAVAVLYTPWHDPPVNVIDTTRLEAIPVGISQRTPGAGNRPAVVASDGSIVWWSSEAKKAEKYQAPVQWKARSVLVNGEIIQCRDGSATIHSLDDGKAIDQLLPFSAASDSEAGCTGRDSRPMEADADERAGDIHLREDAADGPVHGQSRRRPLMAG